jgi:LAO/AO transport system kinase
MRVERRAAARSASLAATDQALVEGVLARDARALAKAITLIESSRDDHQARAHSVLDALAPHTGNAYRIGVTGAPGAGKSTFIEAFGLFLVARGHRVAVLAVDPSSAISGGSILGDKTRMERLSREPNAFIRPSPSSGLLGGVAEKTREAMLACEAAGYDIVLVETVGVGQSETTVAGMTDFFILLALPNAGDDLQAIKRGIIELVDLVAVNKADSDPRGAHLACTQIANALTMLHPPSADWSRPVIKLSALNGDGLDELWREAERYRAERTASGAFADKRRRQALDWMAGLIEHALHAQFHQHSAVKAELAAVRKAVAEGAMTPAAGAAKLLALAKS